jgi:hypothetical protein
MVTTIPKLPSASSPTNRAPLGASSAIVARTSSQGNEIS